MAFPIPHQSLYWVMCELERAWITYQQLRKNDDSGTVTRRFESKVNNPYKHLMASKLPPSHLVIPNIVVVRVPERL